MKKFWAKKGIGDRLTQVSLLIPNLKKRNRAGKMFKKTPLD
jgi:hypothetical protein